MKIPTHWSKAIAEETDRKGRKVAFICWRWSDLSPEDARQSALAAAKRVLQRLARGEAIDRYGYGETPLREEIIQQLAGPQDEPTVVITRNAYGALVLNASRVMFIDLDFPDISFLSPLKLLMRIFRIDKLLGRPLLPPEAQSESDAWSRLKQFAADHPSWAIRVYRTCRGLRAMVTHDFFDPASASTLVVLESVGADPLYVRLCKAQQCFRARLTPKPWRCGHYRTP